MWFVFFLTQAKEASEQVPIMFCFTERYSQVHCMKGADTERKLNSSSHMNTPPCPTAGARANTTDGAQSFMSYPSFMSYLSRMKWDPPLYAQGSEVPVMVQIHPRQAGSCPMPSPPASSWALLQQATADLSVNATPALPLLTLILLRTCRITGESIQTASVGFF